MVVTARQRPTTDAEFELLLERSAQVASSRMLLLIFWGLILAKCVLLQWLILTYDVPVDGGLFVWAPSIIFGALCSLVYGKVTLEEFHRTPLTSRLVKGIWAACIVAMGIFGVVAVGFQEISPFVLPAVFAVLMGVGFFIQGMLDLRPYLRVAAVGWWLGSIWLFYRTDASSLLSLGVMVVAFQVCPTFLLLRHQRKRNGITQAG